MSHPLFRQLVLLLLFPTACIAIVFGAFALVSQRSNALEAEISRMRDTVIVLNSLDGYLTACREASRVYLVTRRREPSELHCAEAADGASEDLTALYGILGTDRSMDADRERLGNLVGADLGSLQARFKNPPLNVPTKFDPYLLPIRNLSARIDGRMVGMIRDRSAEAARLNATILWLIVAGLLFPVVGAALSFAIIAQSGRSRERVLSRYQLLAENAQDIILFVRTRDMQIMEVNAAACTAYGYSADELRRMTVYQLRPPELRSELRASTPEGRRGSVGYETVHMRKNGERFPVWVKLQYGEIDGEHASIGVLNDISATKRHEKELQEARDTAIAAADLKSRFVATMSHEIRTPMNAIVGVSEMLLHANLPPEEAGRVTMLHQASESLLGLVNDLLDLSKIEADQMEFSEKPVALETLVRETLGAVEPQAVKKHLQLGLFVDAGFPRELRGDPLRIRQVVLNLLTNAVKFTERGSIVVTLRLLEEGEQSCRILIEVRDTGIGIAPEHLDSIFAPFVQADTSWKRRAQGTGLGLWISRLIVERMGGEIGVHSEPGIGSTFWFSLELPALSVSPSQAQPEEPPRSAAELQKAEQNGRAILIAEDNALNREVIAMQLDQLGYRADLVDDGRAALKAVSARCYDLILMDCQMPEVDGLEATRRIRAMETEHRVPILAMTANAIEDESLYLAAGFDGILPKPVTLARLRSVCERWAA